MSGAPALPLDRWATAVATLQGQPGDGGASFLTAIASLLFEVSSLVWQVLGAVVTGAQGTSTAQAAVGQVDAVYARLGGLLLGAGGTSIVVVVAVASAAMVASRAVRRGEGTGGLVRGLAGVVVPVAALLVTVHAAGGPAMARGSPAWAVARVSGWTTALTGTVASLDDHLPQPTGLAATPPDIGQPDCAGYLRGLDALYAERDTQPGSGPPGLQGADGLALSRLWESAVMAPWEQAQFGPGPIGAKVYCHLLDIQGDVPATDQLAAMAADTGGSEPTWSQLLAVSRPPDPAATLGPTFADGDVDVRRAMTSWASCDWAGTGGGGHVQGWVIDGAFTDVNPNPSAAACQSWWADGQAGPLDLDDQATIVQDTANAAQARSYLLALDGPDPGRSLATSMVALTSSATYGISLGGLALGVLLSKVCLILIVACLPLVLLLAAIPTATTRTAARRAGGLLIGSLASTWLLSLLLGALLLLIGLLQTASADLVPTSGDLVGLDQALVPLAAVVILRRVLRRAGMGSVATLRGALRTSVTLVQVGTGSPPPPSPLAGSSLAVAGLGARRPPRPPMLHRPPPRARSAGPVAGALPPAPLGPTRSPPGLEPPTKPSRRSPPVADTRLPVDLGLLRPPPGLGGSRPSVPELSAPRPPPPPPLPDEKLSRGRP